MKNKKKNRSGNAHLKDILREIGKTWTRFVSILIMTALGVFVMVGLKVTGPKMRDNIRNHIDKQNMYDIYVSSPIGLDSKDIDILSKVDDVSDFEKGYYTDVSYGEHKIDFRIMSLPEKISFPEIMEGRMPEKSGEIVIELTPKTDIINLGDKIVFEHENGKFKENKDDLDLKTYEFTVVGKVISTDYLVQGAKGTSETSAGTLDTIAFINEEDFDKKDYSYVKYILKDTAGLNPDGSKYKKISSDKKAEIKSMLEPRASMKFVEIKDRNVKKIQDAENDIQEGRDKLEDAEKKLHEADKKLKDARQELEDSKLLLSKREREGRKKIDDAKKELKDGQEELDKGKVKYQDGLLEYEKQEKNYLDAKKEVDENEQKLIDAQNKIGIALKQLRNGISEGRAGIATLSAAISQIETNIRAMESAGMDHSALDSKLSELQGKLSQAESDVTGAELKQKELIGKQEELKEESKKLVSAKKQLVIGKNELDKAKDELAEAEQKIKENEKKIADARIEVSDGEEKMNREVSDAKNKINKAEIKISDGEKEYQDNLSKFEKEKIDADKVLNEGEAEIKDAKELLDKLKAPKFSVQTRDDNESLFFMYDSSHKLDIVSWIFPVFFFFVAILVSITTMTRMVEEKRIEVGTYKALGYSTSSIMLKYLLYGLFSSLLGGILGAVLGSVLLPKIIYHAYAASFVIKEIHGISDPITNISAILLGTTLNVVAVLSVVFSTLKENAANLLRPKAPKKSKKILLEKIDFIWNKLKFLNKVTLRNVFRYKSRMFMTIFGIAGCTGLLFLGFALRESLAGVRDYQFEDIQKYDLSFMVDDLIGKNGESEYKKILESDQVSAYLQADTEVFTYQLENGRDQKVIAIIPNDITEIDNFIHMAKQKSVNKEEEVEINDVVTTHKLYRLLEKNGNIFEDSDLEKFEIPVSDYYDNYMGHYIIMSKDYYENRLGKEFELNSYYLKLADGVSEDEIITKLKDNDSVLNVSDASTQIKTIDDWTGSINAIVLIIVICSTLLAMVVLYNLSNINISERMRELSTIKVLGFSNKELTHYAYRETYILTVIGILVGYLFGWGLFISVVEVLPPEHLMLSTTISYVPYLLSACISLIFSFIVGLIVQHKLKTIDMVSSLKAYE